MSRFFFKVCITLSVIAFVSCNREEAIDIKNIFEKASKSDSLSYYFPPLLSDTIEHPNAHFKDFKQRWYSSSLYSFKEPILYTKSDSNTIYRLLILRSFHHPVCFTIKELNGDYYLNSKRLDRQPEFFPWPPTKAMRGTQVFDTIVTGDRLAFINYDTIIALRTRQMRKIEKFLSKLDFWNSPVADPHDEHTTDGSNWIIEGRKNSVYHFIDRRNATSDLRDFGKYLIRISGLKIKDDSIY